MKISQWFSPLFPRFSRTNVNVCKEHYATEGLKLQLCKITFLQITPHQQDGLICDYLAGLHGNPDLHSTDAEVKHRIRAAGESERKTLNSSSMVLNNPSSMALNRATRAVWR